mmetsp:Transcript_13827/g.11789  ORF Transcript_13827/g.11789 Transcript_13827/m.11789 type:complete len:383 (+) Transcript_13827:60-1208(+)|eukprot:CAMPEP_0114586928 /NCGR_PEP_ID=MMETSP0125-20121206/10017_1 /TAXON_ID=485358 ORGANISM="Aristerostoma sp., Strain ATCC 50986" /NCGR_SAMPLE_ID=MMETSP0125 /ASSEMBLY_ACC=CAM_ASM_000245 /LENGTH=382 /DNA_ID=CAMNT_0001782587 /DNA_START=58 /DNA_END=1206 /DNA_ORIENTATION=-
MEKYEEGPEETLATPGVLDKYQQAGKIVNAALEKVIAKTVAGAKIVEVCEFGDKYLEDEVKKVYNKKKMEKGIAFPTCISVNNVCGHFSPLRSEESEDAILKEGDVAKIDLGCHIDGFIAQAAHTVVVGKDKSTGAEGRKAEVILAAYNALQASLRHLRPGSKNYDVTETVEKISETFGCNPVEGVLSHEVKKHLIDGNNSIINKQTYDQKVEEFEFGVNQVFGLDIIISTGEGKPKETEFRTTVFKRALERSYSLKLKAARTFFAEVTERFPTLAFSLRSFDDENVAKMGIKESMNHDLFYPYPVLADKKGEVVAHFKYTVAILKNSTQVLAGLPLDASIHKTDKKITDQAILDLLATSMEKKDLKKKEKKAKKEGDEKKE